MQLPAFLTNGFGRRSVVQYAMIQDQEKVDATIDYSQQIVTPKRKRRHLGFFLRTTVELGLLMLLYRSVQNLDACSTRLPSWQNSAVLPARKLYTQSVQARLLIQARPTPASQHSGDV